MKTKSVIRIFTLSKKKVYGIYFGSRKEDTSLVIRNAEFVKYGSTRKGYIVALKGENVSIEKHWISGKTSIIPIENILYLIDLGTELEYKKSIKNN